MDKIVHHGDGMVQRLTGGHATARGLLGPRREHEKSILCTLKGRSLDEVYVMRLTWLGVSDDPVDPDLHDEDKLVRKGEAYHKTGDVVKDVLVPKGAANKFHITCPPGVRVTVSYGPKGAPPKEVAFVSDAGYNDDDVRFSWLK